ncbi:MAG: ATP-binding protein [Thermoplasmata archaeon]|jgi:MinD superfamily P-loop ATPase|nr:ATP-binding protein [Thermoplasmata archaeon]
MRISIASGKGGTGKTLVATNLAAVAGHVTLADLDVEEPNCHLFFGEDHPTITEVVKPVPKVNAAKCNSCGKCAEICEFHALAVIPKGVMVFEAMCHSCGACSRLCPEGAITEVGHPVGEIIVDDGEDVRLVYGLLRVGEPSAVGLIRKVLTTVKSDPLVISDCPPGTACTATEAVRGSDYCVLVTEPTPFGIHDLELAAEMVRKVGVRAGVFVNKLGLPGPDVEAICTKHGLKVIGTLPHDRRIAERYSSGDLLAVDDIHAITFNALLGRIKEEVSGR